MDNYKKNLPVETFYHSREDFTIIGLTGLAGSGCSTLAKIMEDPRFFEYNKELRLPDKLRVDGLKREEDLLNVNQYHFPPLESSAIKGASQLIFKREYTICYNFLKQNYQPYRIIKYTNVLWLYVLLSIKNSYVSKSEDLDESRLIAALTAMLKDKFALSHEPELDKAYKEKYLDEIDKLEFFSILKKSWNKWGELVGSLKALSRDYLDEDSLVSESKAELARFFFGIGDKIFVEFVQMISDVLAKIDYYCLCFLYHRLACVIRKSGNPLDNSDEVYDRKDFDKTHVFDVVKLINTLIKGMRKTGERDENGHIKVSSVRVVIDSIRNSLEAMYLKERYNAFYLIAVHCDDGRNMFLKKKIKEIVNAVGRPEGEELKSRIDCLFDRICDLTEIETKNKDFEKGLFSSPNVSQCIADSEIHILNTMKPDPEYPDFNSMSEQWLKYASLILHPGIITPSSEERCMVVAYTAKFNSGCLSRQVGAVITNQNHSIRTVGWNDVPYGQVPCSLREMDDHIRTTAETKSYYTYVYSDFERNSGPCYEGKSFLERVREDYDRTKNYRQNLHGLPFPYCFKTLHNCYEGKANQVHTRSLHAEENAMLQMVKYGGEPLKNGIIYVTASPCELCCKKLYQIGVRKIVYIDPYPGISRKNIIRNGFKRPALKLFQGAYGSTYFKLYQPFMPYKDELNIRLAFQIQKEESAADKVIKILDKSIGDMTEDQKKKILERLEKNECNQDRH